MYADVSEHCSIFIGGVSRKNNWVEVVAVFIQENVWPKSSLSQLEGGGTGRGRVRAEIQAARAETSSGGHVRETWCCVGVRKGSHGMVEIKLLCFRWLSPFFKHMQKGFPEFAYG